MPCPGHWSSCGNATLPGATTTRWTITTHRFDPYFAAAGGKTDAEGRYRFTTIRPGAYPWRNHANAWRPAHIHFSVFGHSMLERLVTQMYFPDDPLLGYDPIFNSVPSERARGRLVSHFDLDVTRPEWALGYVFDMGLRGPEATPSN